MKMKTVSRWSKDFLKYKDLQKRAFPQKEQYPFWALQFMAMQPEVKYYAYYDEEVFCGITYTSATEHMLYLLYLRYNNCNDEKALISN